MSLTDIQWKFLLSSIEKKKCTPFIGAGCLPNWLPLAKDIAGKWTKEFGYPLDDPSDLSSVAQFLAVTKEELSPKFILSEELREKKPPNFALPEYKDTVFSILADLNLPIYLTTNYDHFMEAALESKGKAPVSEYCRWNNYAKAAGIHSVFDNNGYRSTVANPLVYHLHGDINTYQSMVLTESDYIDFVVNLNSQTDVLPDLIKEALNATSLLFVGYGLRDVNLRIIFRGIMNFVGSQFLSPNVAVMLPPAEIPDDRKELVKEYLKQLTKKMFKADVYWGDVSLFSEDLRKRWNDFRSNNQSK